MEGGRGGARGSFAAAVPPCCLRLLGPLGSPPGPPGVLQRRCRVVWAGWGGRRQGAAAVRKAAAVVQAPERGLRV